MGRVKLKIMRLETIDVILDACAKRKSKIMIQDALLKEEEQKARVQDLELKLKQFDAEINQVKELDSTGDMRKHLEGNVAPLSPSKKREAVMKKKVFIKEEKRTLEARDKFISDIDFEREILKKLEKKRKVFQKGAYVSIKEGLRIIKKLPTCLDVEPAKDAKHDVGELEKDQLTNYVRQILTLDPEVEQ